MASSAVDPSSEVLDGSGESLQRLSQQASRLAAVRAVDVRLIAALQAANPALGAGEPSSLEGVETFAQSLLETEALLAAFPREIADASRELLRERYVRFCLGRPRERVLTHY
jgi:hypothetical protein